MSQRVESPETTVNFSMQNLVDTSTLWALLAPIETFTNISKSAGYQGVEYFPYRIPHTQVRTGLLSKESLRQIDSAHQSFRTEKNLGEVKKHPRPILALKAFITMPEKVASLTDLKILQRKLGKLLPVIVYPQNEWAGETRPAIFDTLVNKLIQPAPELISTLGQNMEKADQLGYKLCLDLFHIRRKVTQGFSTQFRPWQEMLPLLLPQTKEIHLAVGRQDFEGSFDSMAELVDLYYGTRRTDIIPMLELIHRSGWQGPIVTEIPANSITKLAGVSEILTPTVLVNKHRVIADNVRSILSY